MAFSDRSQCKPSLDSYYPRSLRFLQCGTSFPYCFSVVILHIDYVLYCSSFISPKQTCLILQFSSVPCDLCKPQLRRLLGMKCNEMAQRWCGCGPMMAACSTHCQDSHRAGPIPKWASGGSRGLTLKTDSRLSTPTHL